MTVYEKLMNIQTELKAPKNQLNKFGGYNYRNCEDILEAVKPLVKKQGCALVLSDKPIMIGNRIYIEATATLVDTESSDKICVSASAREEENKKGMDASQISGAASSYARKYALNGLFAIDDSKDSDATNNHGKEEPKKQEAKITNVQFAEIEKLLDVTGVPVEKIQAAYHVSDIRGMTKAQAEQCIAKLKKNLQEVEAANV